MFFYDTTYILLIPAIIFAMVASNKVNRAFARYSRVPNLNHITGAQAARMVLDRNGLSNVEIKRVNGRLTDFYDPRSKSLSLSDDVYSATSVAAISVACHEVGHAIQDNVNYAPLKIRNGIVPIVNFGQALTWPLVFIGLMLMAVGDANLGYYGNIIVNVGIICFLAVVIFHTITLPVEINASRRAIQQMESLGIVQGNEVGGAKQVLKAAALTYVAALAMAIANLLRLIALRDRNS